MATQRQRSIWRLVAVGVILLAGLMAFAACGDDGDGNGNGDANGDAAAVEAAVQAAIDAWNSQDVEGFLAAFTDQGFMDSFDAPKEEAPEFLPGFMEDTSISIENLEVEVSGDTATASGAFILGTLGSYEQLSLIREAEAWLVDGQAYITGEPLAGATVVDLTLLEYQFNFDADAITSGGIAFNVENIGGEEHEVAIFSVPEDLDLEQAVQSEEEPEGVAPLGYLGPYAPGDATTIVSPEPLAPGRYALLCFVETADGEDHASLGMLADFTIAGNGGETPEDGGETPAE